MLKSRSFVLGVLAAAAALVIGLLVAHRAPPASAGGDDAGARVESHRMGSLGPGGTGMQCFIAGAPQTPAVNGGSSQALVGTDGGCPTFRQLTQDDIAAGLTVTLSGGGATTLEVGATWTPSAITASPACNASGVTACTLSDTNAGSVNDTGVANTLSSPSANYTQNSASTVGITLAMTKGGVGPRNSNTLTSTWIYRWFSDANASSACSTATASSNNASLSGGGCSGTITGHLSTLGVGTTFTITPSGTGYGYLLTLHTASAHTFTAASAPFPMSVVATISFTNQFSQVVSMDLYQNPNPLTSSYTVTVAS